LQKGSLYQRPRVETVFGIQGVRRKWHKLSLDRQQWLDSEGRSILEEGFSLVEKWEPMKGIRESSW
jgi:hypothetical protein